MKRGFRYILALIAGLVIGSTVPLIQKPIQFVLSAAGLFTKPSVPASSADPHGHGSKPEGPEGVVVISAEQIATSRIDVQPAAAGALTRRITAPAVVMADPDRVTWVAAKVTGTVAELNKRLGDWVKKGEVVAVIESREVAEAKSEYLAAQVNFELQSMLFEREKSLFEKRITPEQQFLKARNVSIEARLRLDLARQKLAALDLSESEIASLPKQPVAALRRKELRALASGRVTERRVDLGAPVGGEGQEKVLYGITDLSSVWVDLAVPSSDLSVIKDGQTVLARLGDRQFEGEVAFVSPTLNQDTRSARVIARFSNQDFALRSGAYLTAHIVLEEIKVALRVPRTALQTINKEQILFVRHAQGFEKREVAVGISDDDSVEIVFGLESGEEVAITNTFILKADLGKAEAEHAH